MNPIPEVKTMSSREIAELTGKRHADVLRDIRKMLSELNLSERNFASSYFDDNNQERPAIKLNQDLTMTLVSGYKVQMRFAIIERWRQLEELNAPALPDFNDPVASARAWADAKESEQKALLVIKEQAPKVEFVDKYVASDTGNKGFRQVAKLLKVKENWFREYLVQNKIMYKLDGEWVPYQNHTDASRFEVKAGTKNNHAYNTAKFTPKGVQWIAELIGEK